MMKIMQSSTHHTYVVRSLQYINASIWYGYTKYITIELRGIHT